MVVVGESGREKKHKVTLPSSLGCVNDPAESDTSSLMHTTTIETIPSSQVKGEAGVTVCESETAPFRAWATYVSPDARRSLTNLVTPVLLSRWPKQEQERRRTNATSAFEENALENWRWKMQHETTAAAAATTK